jgi:uncharacterized BrkB/YihY/UPF0761 family membrane protein
VIVFYTYGYLFFVLCTLFNVPEQIVHIIDKFLGNLTTSSNSQQRGILVVCLWVDFIVPFCDIMVTPFFCFCLTC